MVCNRDGCSTAQRGDAVGAPDTEAIQMSARQQQHCPGCGAFLRADGGCTRCAALGADDAAAELIGSLGDVFHDPTDGTEGAAMMKGMAGNMKAVIDGLRARHAAGTLTESDLQEAVDQAALTVDPCLYDPDPDIDGYDRQDLYDNVREQLDAGLRQVVGLPGIPGRSGPSPVLMGMASLGQSPISVAHAVGAGPLRFDADFWKREFADARGMTLTLSNGEQIDVGTHYSGKKHPSYTAKVGKKKDVATVGASLVPAIDGIREYSDVTRAGRALTRLVATDGSVAHYDHEQRQATCTCGDSPCLHQIAAMLVGETNLSGDGADAERGPLYGEIEGVLREKQAGAVQSSTLVRSADCAYAYLSAVAPSVDFGSDALEQDLQATAAGSPGVQRKNCPACGAFLAGDGTCSKCGYPSGQVVAAPTPVPDPTAAAPAPAPAPVVPEIEPNEATNFIRDQLKLVAPVPDRDDLPEWLAKEIPKPDPGFVMTSVARKIINGVGGMLKLRWGAMKNERSASGQWPTKMTGRAFGLYGPPGTGKNTAAKELAAALQLPYIEEDVNAATDFQRLLGEVTLENGTTKAKLGKIGNALVNGSVVCINEVVSADPAIQTALHQAAQDGILTIPGPEGAELTFRVHPNSVLFLTWNPTGGNADRPTEALTERLQTMPVDLPTEVEERQMLAARLQKDFGIEVTADQVRDDVSFFRQIRGLAQQGRLAREPGFRTLMNFAAMRMATGDPDFAMEQVMVSADQDPMSLGEVRQELGMYLGRYTF